MSGNKRIFGAAPRLPAGQLAPPVQLSGQLFKRQADDAVVAPLLAALQWLERDKLATEGLWRMPGHQQSVRAMMLQADSTGSFLPVNDQSLTQPHDLVSLLIKWMMALPGRYGATSFSLYHCLFSLILCCCPVITAECLTECLILRTLTLLGNICGSCRPNAAG